MSERANGRLSEGVSECDHFPTGLSILLSVSAAIILWMSPLSSMITSSSCMLYYCHYTITTSPLLNMSQCEIPDHGTFIIHFNVYR